MSILDPSEFARLIAMVPSLPPRELNEMVEQLTVLEDGFSRVLQAAQEEMNRRDLEPRLPPLAAARDWSVRPAVEAPNQGRPEVRTTWSNGPAPEVRKTWSNGPAAEVRTTWSAQPVVETPNQGRPEAEPDVFVNWFTRQERAQVIPSPPVVKTHVAGEATQILREADASFGHVVSALRAPQFKRTEQVDDMGSRISVRELPAPVDWIHSHDHHASGRIHAGQQQGLRVSDAEQVRRDQHAAFGRAVSTPPPPVQGSVGGSGELAARLEKRRNQIGYVDHVPSKALAALLAK
jgi:hypothetical protein